MFSIVSCLPLLATEISLHGDAVIKFATVAEATQHLSQKDRFIQATSPFDRDSRLKKSGVTQQQLVDYAAAQALAWDEVETAKLTQVMQRLKSKFNRYAIPFPKTVLLIKTTGKEEGDAAYCRGNAIILPKSKVAGDNLGKLERLMTHELFHILSSHNSSLRSELYKIIGFTTCNTIQLPQTLKHRKITNPDAPRFDCVIELEIDGKPVNATPVLFASVEKYDPKSAKTFFQYLTFKLMVVEQTTKGWVALLTENRPQMLDPKNVASYFDQIGRNTGYIIHPDEILADNFVHMVQGSESLATPGIVEKMNIVFEKP
ncbi:MAG: hypothetical protein COA78_04865 [Blastopirellula sp.]|nr:MAG: hypothetical protein COA78_04865 [Blastopirellula sp.]